MSEYQYYEFQAVDCPLTTEDMKELRSHSTRATITNTSFRNEYHWGGFKGNEVEWMAEYFDLFLYYANWGTHIFMISLPSNILAPGIVKSYCVGENTKVYERDDRTIIEFSKHDEESWFEHEAEGAFELASFLPIRTALLHDDLRVLYLGWLLNVQNGECDEKDLEPPIPPGLKQFNNSLQEFVKFLGIDTDLIEAGAALSSDMPITSDLHADIAEWIEELPTELKDKILYSIILGGMEDDYSSVHTVINSFYKGLALSEVKSSSDNSRRTVGELLTKAKGIREERKRAEKEKKACEKAMKVQQLQMRREKRLDEIAGKEASIWREIGALVNEKIPKSYEKAIDLIIDLRDLAKRIHDKDFSSKLTALQETHARKSSFIQMLKAKGLI
ncbi:MAG: hypothetical protein K0S74_1573 [Chlamydiales bacterium]|jgi:hypothetical protein|nr:hypothetical protein [Chlamydiales bacterium]